jgi:hypothetical protein
MVNLTLISKKNVPACDEIPALGPEKMAPREHRGAIFTWRKSGDQNFTVTPEYSEDSVQVPLLFPAGV